MINIKGSYIGNLFNTQEAINLFSLIQVSFKVGELSELTQMIQLLEEGKITRRYVFDTSIKIID
ncbi:unnamed protein product [Tuber aestivum]|uniref:Uncharacterized protein n=1 Tax=Tuber aestivum TaxID=59557 RepID=A0A292PV89_9PEZI|nr:unnamed protein product [Tuber aestivum]